MKVILKMLTLFVAGFSLPVDASEGLSNEEAQVFLEHLWEGHQEMLRKKRSEEMEEKRIKIGEHTMRFVSKDYGNKPTDGWSLFISLHGGGGAPAAVNESQWNNQFRLGDAYMPKNAIYLAPRAPTNTWNLWHEAHIDQFLDRLIENHVALEDVNPDSVFLMGYSAGGDGVYQLAPRMADRLAGAAMMAGHPNEASPLGLRNIAFAIHVGEHDGGYNRNSVAKEWAEKLEALRSADNRGYETQIQIHDNKGHWMDLQDRVAVPWLQKFVRNPVPKRVVWQQDDVVHERFYWLALPAGMAKKGQHVTASIEGQIISIEKVDKVDRFLVRLNDEMLDLDKPITVVSVDGSTLFEGKVVRLRETAKRTFATRRDKALTFFAELLINLEANKAMQTTSLHDAPDL